MELVDLRASRLGITVLLEWQMLSEIIHAGFRVLREEPDGQLVNLTPRLIVPRSPDGEMSGAEYRFTDWSAPLSATRYWLEDVDTMGNVTRHGPVEAPPARVRPIPLPIPPGPAPDFAEEAWQ